MRKSLKKAEVWLYTFVTLILLYLITLLFAPDQLQFIGTAVIYSLVGLGSMYGIVNVADNGVRGKFYNENLRGDECGTKTDIQL